MQLLLRVVDATLQPGEIIALLKTWCHLGLSGKFFLKVRKKINTLKKKETNKRIYK